MNTALCPKCQAPAFFKPEKFGRVVVCPKCSTSYVLTTTTESAHEPATTTALPVAQHVPEEPARAIVPPPLPKASEPHTHQSRFDRAVMRAGDKLDLLVKRLVTDKLDLLTKRIGKAIDPQARKVIAAVCGGLLILGFALYVVHRSGLVPMSTERLESEVLADMKDTFRNQNRGVEVYEVHLIHVNGNLYKG